MDAHSLKLKWKYNHLSQAAVKILKTEREKTVYPTLTQALQEVQQKNPMRRLYTH